MIIVADPALLKAHVKGYVRTDGVSVRPHEDKRIERHDLPSSSGISTHEEASAYWLANLGGKTMHIVVHSGDEKIPIKVRFDSDNDHAYTDDEGGRQKSGVRVFDVERARSMSRIPDVIERPKTRSVNYGADVFFEAPRGGKHYTVVLTWRDAKGVYEFHSAHHKPIQEVRRMLAQKDKQKNKGPLQKGGPSSVFAGLQDAQRQGSPSGGYHPLWTGNGMHKLSMVDEILIVKAHVKAHTKKDGTVVKDYERGGQKLTAPQYGLGGAKHGQSHQGNLFGGHSGSPGWLGAKPKAYHPKKGDKGQSVGILEPSNPTAPETWHDEDAVATFVPGGPVPTELNGTPLAPWSDAPTTHDDWDYVDGVNDDIAEPTMTLKPGLKPASGCVIEEPDGRVWLVSPTNGFGGYKTTFPKGKEEDEMSWQANAIKECYEEAGLKVMIVGFLGDVERTTSVTRYYKAIRIGGSPADVGWESQAVHLVPKSKLLLMLDSQADRDVLKLL